MSPIESASCLQTTDHFGPLHSPSAKRSLWPCNKGPAPRQTDKVCLWRSTASACGARRPGDLPCLTCTASVTTACVVQCRRRKAASAPVLADSHCDTELPGTATRGARHKASDMHWPMPWGMHCTKSSHQTQPWPCMGLKCCQQVSHTTPCQLPNLALVCTGLQWT